MIRWIFDLYKFCWPGSRQDWAPFVGVAPTPSPNWALNGSMGLGRVSLMLSLEEWQSAIRPNVPNNWTIFVVYLDIWPMKRLRRGQSLFWVARYFLICDDKTMAFAAQQDKSFDNSPLKGCGSPPQVVSPTATTSESP